MQQHSAGTFDEMMDADGSVRPAYAGYRDWYEQQDGKWLREQDRKAESFFRKTGITFNVYGETDGEERLIPFDMIPRIITAAEWRKLSRGIDQRVRALNMFLSDIYHRQDIVRSGRLPLRLIQNNAAYLSQMVGFTPPGGIYTHIVGIDLVRTGPDEFMVLEDNARTPSGVSYMLENRETMMAMFPELFTRIPVRPVSDYPRRLARSLAACAPECAASNADGRPVVAVLTPGIYNSAYFEHAFLADQMGAELVEGSDLRVVDGQDKEYLRLTRTAGPALFAPPRLSQLRGRYRVASAWLDGRLRTLPGSAAIVDLGVTNEELAAAFGPAECLWYQWTVGVKATGRFSETRTTGVADGFCRKPLAGSDAAAEQPFGHAQAVARRPARLHRTMDACSKEGRIDARGLVERAMQKRDECRIPLAQVSLATAVN